MNSFQNYIEQGFIKEINSKNETFYILSTPCKIIVLEDIVKKLKNLYLSEEEIGGLLYLSPESNNGLKTFVIKDFCIIRNAIENKPIYDKKTQELLTKNNAYLKDSVEYAKEYKKVISNNCFPISFHTHPTHGKNIFESLNNLNFQTETSNQDNIEALRIDIVDKFRILLPRILIVGNKDYNIELFIGVYDGFIAPSTFDNSKLKVQVENISLFGQSIKNQIEKTPLSNNEKLIYGIGAGLLLSFLLYKTRKFSIPVILGLSATILLFLTNTSEIEHPNYFNKLSFGNAEIFIPEI